WIGVAGFALGAFLIGLVTQRKRFDLGPVFALVFFGSIIYRRIRNRRMSTVSRFAKRAGKLPEVRLVTGQGNQITVIVERPTAKTYLKLNSLLASANGGLFHGEPFTLNVRE